MHSVATPLAWFFIFFFQAEDGIRDYKVTGVQTCALPISMPSDAAHACAEMEPEYRNGEVAGERSLGYYEIANVPTETPLILKQSGPSETWTDLYTYNFEISNAEVAAAPADMLCATPPAGMVFRYKARILASADYDSIPLTAGLIGGVPPGNGAI